MGNFNGILMGVYAVVMGVVCTLRTPVLTSRLFAVDQLLSDV